VASFHSLVETRLTKINNTDPTKINNDTPKEANIPAALTAYSATTGSPDDRLLTPAGHAMRSGPYCCSETTAVAAPRISAAA